MDDNASQEQMYIFIVRFVCVVLLVVCLPLIVLTLDEFFFVDMKRNNIKVNRLYFVTTHTLT